MSGHDDTVAATLVGVVAPKGGLLDSDKVAGRYAIVRLLGGGGMGRVYEALDGELGERIALKVLHGGLTDEALERFRREVRLTRKIQHRNVARMFDIGDHAGEKFLTMELIDGEALARAVNGQPIPWSKLREAAIQICAGLAAAHACGVVHRDLKPDNVIVELATGRYVITDFGIARGGDDPNVTMVGAVVGTPRYMAPEQLAGRDTDARADLFSLGVMLYEMASGARPWPGDNPIAIAVAQATQPVQPLVAAGVPAEFIALVMQLLAIEPGDRPATAAELVTRLIATEATDGAPARGSRALTPTTGTPTRPTPVPSGQFRHGVETSLAVMPFACAPGDEYLADGMLEDLIDALSTMPLVKVRPAGLVRGVVEPDVRALGRRLGVEQIASASLRRTPSGLKVSARLTSVADGFQIWAHRADCTEAEIFEQSELLARGIAGALSSRATSATKPTDPRAVDLYLRARAELRQFWGKHARLGADLLRDAARLAPDSPPILGALAYASVQAWVMVAEEDLYEPAVAAVEHALGYGHGEAFLASAILRINTGDTLGAAADLRLALARAPMSGPSHEYLGKLLVEIGAVDEGLHHFTTAMGLDPARALLITSDMSRVHALMGDLDKAYAGVAQIEASPDESLKLLAEVFRARLAGWHGQRDPMRNAAARLASRFGPNAIRLATVVHEAYDGRPVDRAIWDAGMATYLAENRPKRLVVLALQLLAESAASGRADELVFSAIDHACRVGLIDIVWFDRCPLFDRFRGDLRWLEVRARVAAHAEGMLAVLHE